MAYYTEESQLHHDSIRRIRESVYTHFVPRDVLEMLFFDR